MALERSYRVSQIPKNFRSKTIIDVVSISWCKVDGDGTRFLLGDSFGRLALLSFDITNYPPFILVPLGEVGVEGIHLLPAHIDPLCRHLRQQL